MSQYPSRYSGGNVNHRKVAKAGMAVSLATAMATGYFMKGKAAKRLHTAAAIALVGFVVYHHAQYD